MNGLYNHIERLGKERGYKNMTVLCKAAGVPRSTMSELNNGRSSDLSKPNAQKFADLLGVSLDDVYNKQKESAPAEAGKGEIGFDDFTYAMQDESKGLTEEDKALLLSMARQLKAARDKRNGKSD